MSKELEYEFNNFVDLLNKDCMNLMECLKKQDKDNKAILYLGKHFKKVILPYEEYQKMCSRLESIDNANPSEALECLEKLFKSMPQYDSWIKYIDTIKQALLKTQFLEEEYNNLMEDKDNLESELFKLTAPKQYLKWEDLEFTNEEQSMQVLLNGKKYTMFWYSDEVCFDTVVIGGVFIDCCDKQFFNDLHLERVKE